MTNHTVITIGRQLGSGGKEVGLQLAEELGIKCYDKELLERAAKDVDCARNYLKTMMKNLQIVSCIPW